MKTIIAGTDFTPSSLNACKYAALTAEKLNCKLVIFNLFLAPVLHSNSGLYGISYSAVKKTSQQSAEKVVQELSALFPSLKISAFSTDGSFEEELQIFTSRHRIEAVVMGLEAKTRISKFIWGSHGVNIIGKINAPVILVPEKYRDHRLESILLAVDNVDKLSTPSFKEVEKFVKASQTRLELLHVRTPEELIAPGKVTSLKINKTRQDVMQQKAKTVEDGIKWHCRDHNVDLVVILSQKHSVFYNLFNESVTKRVAFSAKVPVMAMHE
jgi:nucleotide-binding universal stress UspA family protein